MEITNVQRRHLRALAHSLSPIVMIGNQGLTDSVIREIAQSLDAHELLKIRIHGKDRQERVAISDTICQALGAAPVQHIGNLLIVYRPADKPTITFPK